MFLISNKARREIIKLLEAYRASAYSRLDSREFNNRRRAGLLIDKLKKSQQIRKKDV